MTNPFFIAFGKAAGHREVAPRAQGSLMCILGISPRESRREKKENNRKNKNIRIGISREE